MVIAFDTETKGFDWWNPDQQAFLASWADERGEYVSNLANQTERERFINALAQAGTVVGHNLKFDIHQARATTGFDVLSIGAKLADTDTMSRVLFPEGQTKGKGAHGLKNLGEAWIDESVGDSEDEMLKLMDSIGIKKKDGMWPVGAYYDCWRAYPEQMEHYARMDARITWDLHEKFSGMFDENSGRCYALEEQVTPVLVRAEERGICTDQEVVAKMKHDFELQAEELHDNLMKTLGEQALGGEGSQDALIEALIGLGVPLYRKTDSGKFETNKFALQEFAEAFPFIEDIFEFRRVNRFLSTYISAMYGNEVVHTNFRQCEAWTGRTSSARPNMQNLPKRAGKEVRAAFVPREGHSFVVCDYEGIEFKELAWYLGNQEFRDKIAGGWDAHPWMASLIYGGTEDLYQKGTDGQDERDVAKNTTYAICYGAGKPRVADMNNIDRTEAGRIIKVVKDNLPGFHRLNKRIKNKVMTQGHVTTLFGRKQPVKRDKAYVGLNALIQGSGADIMKQGLVNVAAAVEDLGGVPLLVVHDEVVVEVPTENAQEAYDRTCKALVDAYPLDPPLTVEGSIVETNYAEA